MIRSMLLLVAIPFSGILAQSSPIHVLITSPNQAEFRVLRPALDSARGPVVARGRLELALDSHNIADATQGIQVATMDTVNKVHVEATRHGRVIASGDGAFVTIRRQAAGVVFDVRSQLPAAVGREPRRPR